MFYVIRDRVHKIYASAACGDVEEGCGIGGGGSSFVVFSAIILWKPIPTPSMTARRMAQPMAPLRMARAPPRTAKDPPCPKLLASAHDGGSSDSVSTVFSSIVTYGEKTCDYGVPWILLLSYSFDCAVKCAEKSSPHAKVAS